MDHDAHHRGLQELLGLAPLPPASVGLIEKPYRLAELLDRVQEALACD